MRICLATLITVCLLHSLPARSGENSIQQVRAEVGQVLHAQQEAWNRHDLEGFMAGYLELSGSHLLLRRPRRRRLAGRPGALS
jgi:hypothetical protein